MSTLVLFLGLVFSSLTLAGGHRMDMDSMVMNENPMTLPEGCGKIAGNQTITVHAGRKYAHQFPGVVFAYDRQSWEVPPCTRLTVRFINEDDIRHQFMVHGLPEKLYSQGMFHIEISGRGEAAGTFILPPDKKTYLVHCDIAQHTEHGMKAQLKVGGGDGNLSSLPGLTQPVRPDTYPTRWTGTSIVLLILAVLGGGALIWLLGKLWRMMLSDT
ncbi:MAG: copper oxidase [Methylohalobius sp. ZOD2]